MDVDSDATRRLTGLVGRDAELGRLRAAVTTGGRVLVVVRGEAGIGKSALVNELTAGLRADGVRVLHGGMVATPPLRFGMWRRPAHALEIALPDRDPSVGLSEQEWELADVLVAGLVDAAPAVVVLEDLHQADVSSLNVALSLTGQLAGSGVVLLATVRDEPGARHQWLERMLREAEVVQLGALTDDAVGSYVARLTGKVPSAEDLAALRRRTGGNPLLVRELTLAGHEDAVGGPAVGMLASTLEPLGSDTADVLGALAVAGAGAPLPLVAEAAGMTVQELQHHLDVVAAAKVVLPDDRGRLWFRHDLLADAAQHRLGPQRCRELHLLLGHAARHGHDPHGIRRVTHLAAAVPLADPTAVVDAALDAADGLVRRRRAGDAADVIETALRACAGHRLAPEQEARLWLALGEARWQLGDESGAVEAFESAAETAQGVDDVEVVATVEVARRRRLNPLIPDPAGRTRLADLDSAIGPGDSALRVALLGRRAVFALQPPADRDAAATLAAEALAMARRLSDPGVLLGALSDHFFVGGTVRPRPGERAAAADEAIELARRAGRPEQALIGYEWRFSGHLDHGDLHAAARVVDDLETLAAVSPSPALGLSATVRRAVLLAFQGDRDAALAMTTRAAEWARSALADDIERIGMELALRHPIALLYGVADPAIETCLDQMRPVLDLPSPFLQIRRAVVELDRGRTQEARQRAHRWLAHPETAFESPTPLLTLAFMSHLVVSLRLDDLAPPLTAVLTEFNGLLPTDAGHSVELPVDFHLAGLAALVGNTTAAVQWAQAAVALARRMPSPPVEARCLALLADAQHAAGDRQAAAAARASAEAIAEPIGVVLTPLQPSAHRAPPPSDGKPRLVLLRTDGDRWHLDAPDGTGSLPDMIGMSQLRRLLAAPGHDVAATELAGFAARDAPPAANDLGPALDARAKRQYRQRITELRAEIDDADDMADLERAALARIQLDTLLDQLRHAVGLRDSDRPQGSGAERARINVTRNIRRAIAAIERIAPTTGAHLRISIRTGHSCRYQPDPTTHLEWHLSETRLR